MVVPFDYAIVQRAEKAKVAVICHLFYADLATWLLEVLNRAALKADIYISTDTLEKADSIRSVLSRLTAGEATVRVVENRGRDVAPKILTFSDVYQRYDLILFLHSKRSPHLEFGESWRDYLVRCLVGSGEVVESVLEIFRHRPDIGMVLPPHYHRLKEIGEVGWGINFRKSQRLARRMGINIADGDNLDMPSGSIFWSRPKALLPLLNLGLTIDDFPGEFGQIDGTMAHCIERLFLFSCEKAGLAWVKVIEKSVVTTDNAVEYIDNQAKIDLFVEQHQFCLIKK